MALVRINRTPSTRQLITFGLAWLVFFGWIGWQAWHRERHLTAEMIWLMAGAVPAAGCLSPRILARVFVGTSYATYPVGFALSHVVLALVYYLALTPIGLTMRLLRYDPLSRRLDPRAKTYWIRRGEPKSVENYFRQS